MDLRVCLLLILSQACGGGGAGDDSSSSDSEADVDVDVDVDTDDTGTVVTCEDLPPRVEIGTGETDFQSLTALEPVVMVHGPQGGWHMLGSVRVHSMDPIIEVHFTIHDEESGTRVSDNTYRVAVVTDGECSGFYPGMYGYIDVSDMATEVATRPPEVLGYRTVVMTMAVTDYSGRTVTEQLRVTAQPDPIDLETSDVDAGLP